MNENKEKKNTAAELPDEQLEQATGGSDIWDDIGIKDGKCPNCGCTDTPVRDVRGWICHKCAILLKKEYHPDREGVPTL